MQNHSAGTVATVIVSALVLLGVSDAAGRSRAVAQPALAVTYRNSVPLGTTAADQNGATFTVAGLSGLTPLPDGRWCAVMDNSSKLVFLSPAIASDGSLTGAPITGGLTLAQVRDYEDVVLSPRGPGRVVLADESNRLSEWDLATGVLTGEPPVPADFASPRANFGFESLSRAGATLWFGNEEAMAIDGPVSTASAGSSVRLQRLRARVVGGSVVYLAGPQHRYVTAPLHGLSISGSRSGLVALVALDDGRLLSMERSLALGTGLFQSRIYQVGLAGATETSGLASVNSAGVTPVTKTLLWSGFLDNIEGLAIGRRLPGGALSLLGITDDGDPVSVNRLHAWTITGAPCGPADLASPASIALADGELTADDIIAFIGEFVASGPRADVAGPVAPVPDGELTADDIIAFIGLFFAGC
jgi:hypothetical protein